MRPIRTTAWWPWISTVTVAVTVAVTGCADSNEPDPVDGGSLDAGSSDAADAGDDEDFPSGSWSREWTFERLLVGEPPQLVGTEESAVDEAVDDFELLGGFELVPDDWPPSDVEARLEVFGSAEGDLIRVGAEAPNGPSTPVNLAGGRTTLRQLQRLRRDGESASLRLEVAGLRLETLDDNPRPNSEAECTGALLAELQLEVVVSVVTGTFERVIHRAGGLASLDGCRTTWTDETWDTGVDPLWSGSDFDVQTDVDGNDGRWARVQLANALDLEIPLDEVAVGQNLFIDIRLVATAKRERSAESFAVVGFGEDGGVEVAFEGLTFDPGLLRSDPEEPPSECEGDTDGAGRLQFAVTELSRLERGGDRAVILVERVDGNNGEASARVTVAGGTASAGSDYGEFRDTVTFGDGWSGTKAVLIPIEADGVEEMDETLELELVQNGGCAPIGEASEAVLTILDAESRGPEEYVLGGVVTGLAGPGLQLRDVRFGDAVEVDADGPFQMPARRSAGLTYDIRAARLPTNPTQSCTVTNGAGTMPESDVTDIVVACEVIQVEPTLDPSFGSAGKVVTDVAGVAGALRFQPDGKILVVTERALVRFESNGSLDPTFGTGGRVELTVGAQFVTGRGLALQDDGRIVVVGSARVGGNDDFAILRFQSDGRLDGSFGTGGATYVDFAGGPDRAYAALLQSGSEIVAVGSSGAGFPVENDFAMARLTAAGALDTTFGTDGRVTTDIAGRQDLAFAAALLPDDRITVVGQAVPTGQNQPDLGLSRHLADGALDLSFGPLGNGVVTTSWGGSTDLSTGVDVVLGGSGEIFVGLQVTNGGPVGLGVAKFDDDGVLDPTFGASGLAVARFVEDDDNFMGGLALQADGKPVVAGGTDLFTSMVGVARLDTAGALDATFDQDGRVTIDFPGETSVAYGVAIDDQGRIVTAGTTRIESRNLLVLTRHLP